jgi:hypothetical protein
MLLGGGFTIGECGNVGRCERYEIVRAVSWALLWFGSRGGLLGSTPSKNEVSARFCLPVLSDLRLFVDAGDFAAILRGIDCFVCRSGDTGTLSRAYRASLR